MATNVPYNMTMNWVSAQTGIGYEPQRNNHWYLIVTGVPGNSGAGDPNQDLFSISLRSFTLPKESHKKITVPYGNEERKYAGRQSVEDITFKFQEYVGKNTYAMLHAWSDQVYDLKTGTVGLAYGGANSYKKNGTLYLLAPDQSITRQFNLVGLWPMNRPTGEFKKDGDEGLLVDVTFSCDKLYPSTGVTG